MNMSPHFTKHVFAVTATHMRRIAFHKRKAGIFTLRLNDAIDGWVGLNTANYAGGTLEINPTVGFRHQELEALVSTLMDLPPHQYVPPTLVTTIGYLMPRRQFTAWSFQEGNDCEALVAEMVEAVREFGIPFMERNASLSAIYETMQNSGLGIAHQLDYRIPAACVLLGKNRDGEAFLTAKLGAISERDDAASASFMKFADKLRGMLAARNGEFREFGGHHTQFP